jgi:hypothetical protein
MNRFSVWCIFVLSAFDAVLTDIGLRHHYIDEYNLLMKMVYGQGLMLFYAVKLGLPLALLFLAPKMKPRRVTRHLLRLSLSAYAGVMVVHYLWLSAVLRPNL